MEELIKETTPSIPPENKTFVQAEVDAIVKSRLQREREKYEGYDDYKSKAAELETIKKEHDSLLPYKTAVTSLFETEFNSLPEDKRSLVPDSLSELDKLNYIIKNRAALSAAAPIIPAQPTTPEPISGRKEAGLIDGKYATLEEFSEKDPRGYLNWRKSRAGKDLGRL